MKLLWQDPEYRNNQSFNKLTKEERSRRGKIGASIANKNRVKKEKSPTVYSEVFITRNGIIKTIKRNQVSAYRKYGWEKI